MFDKSSPQKSVRCAASAGGHTEERRRAEEENSSQFSAPPLYSVLLRVTLLTAPSRQRFPTRQSDQKFTWTMEAGSRVMLEAPPSTGTLMALNTLPTLPHWYRTLCGVATLLFSTMVLPEMVAVAVW